MQNRYVGDVGDYGKFGLLRILCGTEAEVKLELGIVWYLYPDENHNDDGKHVSYLAANKHHFQGCDEKLYEGLRALIMDESGKVIPTNRHLQAIENSGLLPASTVFYSQPLAYPQNLPVSQRLLLRKTWLDGALAATITSDVVFLDPDNGIECLSVTRTARTGSKYVFWDEIDNFIVRNQSLVIYHHFNRTAEHRVQMEDKLEQMRVRYPENDAFAFAFSRGSSRAYFVIAAPRHKNLLRERMAILSAGPWGRHFTSYVPLSHADE